MPIYIQRKDKRQLETVDEFETRKKARAMVREYRLADPYAVYYLINQSVQRVEGKTMKTFCTNCGFSCRLVRQTVEQYPGQYAVAYLSDCCREEVGDIGGKPPRFGELSIEYEEQKSWEVNPTCEP